MHDNVVKLHEYTESDNEFVLFMEYCNDAEYFDNKIVEVSSIKRTTFQHKISLCQCDTTILRLVES